MPGRTPPVVVISLDGLRAEFTSNPRYECRALHHVAGQGCQVASVEPVYPSLTYPNHTTLMTGVRPARHGIVANARFDGARGPLQDWFWEERWIQTPTLWKLATEQGKKVGIVRWPVTVGAKCSWVIPEIFVSGDDDRARNVELAVQTSTPGLIREILGERPPPPLSFPKDRREHDEWVALAAKFLLRERHPDLLLVHFIEVDHAQHEFGRESIQLNEALSALDRALASLLEEFDLRETRLAIVGDHGFTNFSKVFRVNQFLENEGFGALTKSWKAIAQVDGGMAAVYRRNGADAMRLRESLQKFAGKAYRIHDQSWLRRLGAYPEAFCALDPLTDLALVDGAGALWEELGKTHGRHGDISKDGSLDAGALFAGPGIRAGSSIGKLQMEEIAMILAGWLEIDLPR